MLGAMRRILASLVLVLGFRLPVVIGFELIFDVLDVVR
jgi:hypothetical protein